MTDADRLAYSRDVARSSTERDKSIGRLNLPEATDAEPWDGLDAEPTKPPEKRQDATTEPETTTPAEKQPNDDTEPLKAQ